MNDVKNCPGKTTDKILEKKLWKPVSERKCK